MPILNTLAPLATNAALGLMLSKHNDARQISQQQKLTNMQLAADKQMTMFQREQQMQMWKDTNYSAQKAELEKAGLNPGLLYGMGGAGGATTGGSAASSHGATAQGTTNEIMGMMQLRTQEAQIELMKAQANNLNVDAEKKKGVDTENVSTSTKNIKADTENKILDSIIKHYTGLEAKDQYEQIKAPNRGQENKAWSDELTARQGIASNIYELWQNGKLAEKSNAEVEQLLLSNSKTREETKNIIKTFDLIESNTKGQNLTNALKEYENKMQQETGVAPNASGFIKLIGWLMKSIFKQ